MFWKSSKCRNCETKISTDWNWCPSCGISLKKRDIFAEANRDLRQMEKELNVRIPKFMLKPGMSAKGVSITITSDNSSSPKIEVVTSGSSRGHVHRHAGHLHEHKPARVSKNTEEPETKVERKSGRQTISVNLPDVRSVDDIEIRKLSQSIEIRAFAGDKAYFKLIPIPSNSIVSNEFKDGVLKIEVAR